MTTTSTHSPRGGSTQNLGGKRRVVITGMGAITPLGHSALETWKNVLDGKSGVGKIALFEATDCPQAGGIVERVRTHVWTARWPDDRGTE